MTIFFPPDSQKMNSKMNAKLTFITKEGFELLLEMSVLLVLSLILKQPMSLKLKWIDKKYNRWITCPFVNLNILGEKWGRFFI